MRRKRRRPHGLLAWSAAALGTLGALVPVALADEEALPSGPSPRDLAEEVVVRIPHAGRLEGGVRALAFSSDGRWVAAGGVDGSVYAIDLAPPAGGSDATPGAGAGSGSGATTGGGAVAGALTGPLFRHGGSVAGVSVLGAGARVLVVSAGDDGVVAWALCPPRGAGGAASGQSAKPTGGTGPGGSGSTTPPGASAGASAGASPGASPGASAWPDVVTASAGLGPITTLATAGDGALDATFAPSIDHVVLVGTSSGALAALAPLELPRALWTAAGAHRGAVAALVALDAERFASAGMDGVVRLAGARSGKESKRAPVSKLELTSLAAGWGGRVLAVAGWERGVRLLDAATLKPLRAPLEPHRGQAQSIALVPVGARGGNAGAKGGGSSGAGGSTGGGAGGGAGAGNGVALPALIAVASASLADEMVALTEAPLAGARDGSTAPGTAPPAAKRVKTPGVAAALAASPDGTRLAAGTFLGDVVIYRLGGRP